MKTSALTRAIAIIGVAAASLTACAAQGAGASGTTELTVGVLPSIESAPLFLGQEEGFFAEEGLTLRIASLASGAGALVGPVVSGTYDIAVSDMLTLMTAREAGSDLKLIAPAGSASGDPQADFGALVVNEDASYQNLGELRGAVIGSNSLADTNHSVLRSNMDAEIGATSPSQWGGSSSMQWKEVSYLDATAELTTGTIHAAFLVEPYLTRALNGDKRVLNYTYSTFDPKLDVNAYFTSAAFASDDSAVLERFTRALVKSIEYAAENPDAVRSVMTKYTQTQWNERTAAVLPRYTTDFDLDSATRLAEEAVKYELLEQVPDFDELILG